MRSRAVPSLRPGYAASSPKIHKSLRRRRMTITALTLWLTLLTLMAQRTAPAPGCKVAAGLQRADKLLKQRRYSDAQSVLAQLYSCHNLSPLDTFNIGWFYGRARDFKRALRILQSVTPSIPDPQTHQYAIGLTQFELGDYQSAVDTLKGSQNPDSDNLLGVAYSKLGRYQDAYDIFSADLRRKSGDPYPYFNLITLFADTGNFAEAVDTASKALVVFPGNPDLLIARGAAYMLLGKVSEAHDDFAAAARLAPTDASPRFLLALSDYKRSQYDVSAAELREAIQSGIADSDLHYLLAECLLKLNPTRPQAAIAELDQAISLNPRSVSARTLRGKLWLQEDHPKSAVVDLQLAHRIDPTSHSAAYNLARAYSELGKTAEAKVLYREVDQHPVDAVGELGDHKIKGVLSTAAPQ